MQLLLKLDDRIPTLAGIHGQLNRRFGLPGPFLRLDPVSQLAMGLIGGRTRGEVSKAAFEALLARFGDLEAVRDGPVVEIEDAVHAVTFAEVKAPRLKAALKEITRANGRLALGSLERLSVEAALTWLERLPGVGRKVAAATLNFSTLRMRTLVIDTHHLRVLQRLRLVGRRTNLTQAHDLVMPLLPADWLAEDLDDHHQLMKILGQTICRHRAPICRCCPIQDLCPTVPAYRDRR